jgi:hypothetical protein
MEPQQGPFYDLDKGKRKSSTQKDSTIGTTANSKSERTILSNRIEHLKACLRVYVVEEWHKQALGERFPCEIIHLAIFSTLFSLSAPSALSNE